MRILVLLHLISFLSFHALAQKPQLGKWQGIIMYVDEDVPFEFSIEEDLKIIIKNGDEQIIIEEVVIEGDSLLIPLKPFDAWLKAKVSTHEMTGYWKKGYRSKGIPFHATYGLPRFKNGKTKRDKKWLGNWQVELSSPSRIPYPSVLMVNNDLQEITGTFLTEVSDFRFFSGSVVNDTLMMSSFDGAHAFLFKGVVSGDSIVGTLQMDNNYVETVKGVKDDDALIASPFKELKPGQRPYLDILAAGNPNKRIEEEKYFDKVLVIQLFGTWCPNSMDQTRFLSEWYGTRPEGVEVLAVTYEPNFSTAYGQQRIEDYRKTMQLDYDISLGGKLSKGQAALALPYIDKINAFPTLVLVDKAGFIRYEFSYFNGPATGIYFDNFKEKFQACINELVNE